MPISEKEYRASLSVLMDKVAKLEKDIEEIIYTFEEDTGFRAGVSSSCGCVATSVRVNLYGDWE